MHQRSRVSVSATRCPSRFAVEYTDRWSASPDDRTPTSGQPRFFCGGSGPPIRAPWANLFLLMRES